MELDCFAGDILNSLDVQGKSVLHLLCCCFTLFPLLARRNPNESRAGRLVGRRNRASKDKKYQFRKHTSTCFTT
jgi:hypothetical protein